MPTETSDHDDLAVIRYILSRTDLRWSMGTHMTTDLVFDALEMALWRLGCPRETINHSYRGRQHGSSAYRKIIVGLEQR